MSDQQDDRGTTRGGRSGRKGRGGHGRGAHAQGERRIAKPRRRAERDTPDPRPSLTQETGSPYADAVTAAVALARTGRAADGRERTLTAAVQVLTARRVQRAGGTQATTPTQLPWQADAWRFYDLVGESKFAANWLASAVSRCRLYVGRRVTGSDEPEVIAEGVPAELLADFAGGRGGQAGMMRRAALQLTVTGDTYIVGRTIPGDDMALVGDSETHEWGAYSTEETSWDGGGWRINPGSGSIPLGEDDVVIRCWTPHPRRFTEADSSFLGAMAALRELQGLTDRISAEIDSRLAGAGLLVLPQEFSLPSGQSADGETTSSVDTFVETLIDYMIEPIRDRGTPAAVVPLVITAPGEFINDVKLISFWSELDQNSRELREAALTRLGRSLDMPREVVDGLGASNHWTAWAISEDAVRMHVGPLAGLIADAVTVGYFVPALAQLGVENPADYMICVDTTPLELKPDRGQAARELYDALLVGPDTVRRENGFGEADAPTDEELARMLLLRAMDRVSDPLILLRAIGLALGVGGPLTDAPAIEPTEPAEPADAPADGGDGESEDAADVTPGVPDTQDDARAGGQ